MFIFVPPLKWDFSGDSDCQTDSSNMGLGIQPICRLSAQGQGSNAKIRYSYKYYCWFQHSVTLSQIPFTTDNKTTLKQKKSSIKVCAVAIKSHTFCFLLREELSVEQFQ